jgi:hypothetical protein
MLNSSLRYNQYSKIRPYKKKLPNNHIKERLRWILPIIRKEMKLREVANVFHGSKKTGFLPVLYAWKLFISNYLLFKF